MTIYWLNDRRTKARITVSGHSALVERQAYGVGYRWVFVDRDIDGDVYQLDDWWGRASWFKAWQLERARRAYDPWIPDDDTALLASGDSDV